MTETTPRAPNPDLRRRISLAVALCVLATLLAAWLVHGTSERRWRNRHQRQWIAHLGAPLTRGPEPIGAELAARFEEWATLVTRHPDVIRAALLSADDRTIAVVPPGPFEPRSAGSAAAGGLPFDLVTLPLGDAGAAPTGRRLAVLVRTGTSVVGKPFRSAGFWPVALTAVLCGAAAVFWLRVAVERWLSRLLSDLAQSLDRSGARPAPHSLQDLREDVKRRIDELHNDSAHWRRRACSLQRLLEDRVSAQTRKLSVRLRRAERRAARDPLTGLENRQDMEHKLSGLFERCLSNGQDLALVMLDIDHFKVLNDTLGHQTGDALLQFVGEMLRAHLGGEELAIRYGGDEFLVALPGRDRAEASSMARHLAVLFARHSASLGSVPAPTLCAGIASLGEQQPQTLAEFIGMADTAMYRAKKTRKAQAQRPAGSRS